MRELCFLAAVVLSIAPCFGEVKIEQASDRIMVEIDGKPFTDFFTTAATTKPYLHPLRSASGKVVSRYFPMSTVKGESMDHQHQRGLWFSHGDVNGIDFWANEKSYNNPKTGVIILKKINELKSGKKSGLIAATFDWEDQKGNTILTERRRMTFYDDPVNRMIDVDITLTAAGPVVFGDTKEGTFAIRLAPSLEEPHAKAPEEPKRTGLMRTADGRTGEKSVWGTRAPWVDYAGEVDGEKLGVAIFDHPSNPRHPTYWHSRSYGLFAANIFGLHDFTRDKSKDGKLELAPGQSLHFLYRVVIHPGDADSANLADLYAKFSKIKVKAK